MNKKYLFFIIFIFWLSCLKPSVKQAKSRIDFREYIRAGRWNSALIYFSDKKPLTKAEYFALARAKEGLDYSALNVASAYLQCVKNTGNYNIKLNSLKRHLSLIKENSIGLLYPRLALYKAATYLKKRGYPSLAAQFLRKIRLWPADTLNTKVILLLVKLEKGHKTARERIDLLKRLPNSIIAKIKIAAIWNDLEQWQEALKIYKEVLKKSTLSWVLRTVYYGLKKNPEELHNLLSQQEMMQLIPYLKKSEWKKLKNKASSNSINNCPNVFLRGCGLYLIKSSSFHPFWDLLEKRQNYLRKNSKILSLWLNKLLRHKHFVSCEKIFSLYNNLLTKEKSFWSYYIKYLQKKKEKVKLINTISLAKESFQGRSYHDILMKILLQFSSKKFPSFAPEVYWNRVLNNLSPGAFKARVLYWNYRRLKSQNKEDEAEKILRTFYIRTRGSFYSQAFWQEINNTNNYIKDWKQVKNKQQFFNWLSSYGGNTKAVKYLKKQNLLAFKQRSAWKLIRQLKTLYYHIPSDIMELYKIGEYSLASSYSRKRVFKGKSKIQKYLLGYYIGRKSNNRFLQVWYLQQILNYKGIYSDPFTLPEYLLNILYPRPYYNEVLKASKENGIKVAAIYSLMRQESKFKERAVSRSHALGLMQIMPSTGKWLAKGRKVNLLEPHTSIRLGSKFLADLINRYGGFYWASIAYNGGPGNLRKWKRRYYRNDYYAFLERIPNLESRHYARVTAHNLMIYNIIQILYK